MNGQDQHQLVQLLSESRAVLLDFDGPVTFLLDDGRNEALATRLKDALRAGSGHELPQPIEDTTDHLLVLRFAWSHARHLVKQLEDLSVSGEVDAARVSDPTPGGHETLVALHHAGKPVVVVSNNAADAVSAYLERFNLTAYAADVQGRPYAEPLLMKPHPELVNRALRSLEAPPDETLLIGDSVTDIEVCRLVGIRSVGFAKSPQRRDGLMEAGADAVIDDMFLLARAVAKSRLK